MGQNSSWDFSYALAEVLHHPVISEHFTNKPKWQIFENYTKNVRKKIMKSELLFEKKLSPSNVVNSGYQASH